MITIEHKGSFRKVDRFLKKTTKRNYMTILRLYGAQGVEALREATPKDTGLTSESWSYRIVKEEEGYTIYWENSNTNKGINIALLIQMGHGTRQGAYVQGIDYINPALKKTFEDLSQAIWREVQSA